MDTRTYAGNRIDDRTQPAGEAWQSGLGGRHRRITAGVPVGNLTDQGMKPSTSEV